MVIDSSTEFGKRVERRLRDDQIGWIVTVGTDGTPQPSPVWFLWDGSEILLRSQPDTKVRNIQRNPRVALHLDGDGQGGDIVVLTGTAHVELAAPELPAAYVTKYQDGVKRQGMTLRR
jgi:PPOX class probable F420-dependent enzyme